MNPVLNKTNDILNGLLKQLETAFDADLICIYGPINSELVSLTRDSLEAKKKKTGLKDKLCVLLTTNGGDANSTERLVNVFRHHYGDLEFIVPDHAYSAGTILCMSGDRIWMDYNSVLGPIDPQVLNKENRYVPALGYLDKIESLLEKARNNTISQAEFLILKDFDLAELSQYEQARDLTTDLLKKWLVKYKFKNWKCHSTTGKAVTVKDKENRAEQIAKDLADYKKWKSHGRPLSIDSLRALKLQIDDFELEPFSGIIMEFHNMFEDFLKLQNAAGMVYMEGV